MVFTRQAWGFGKSRRERRVEQRVLKRDGKVEASFVEGNSVGTWMCGGMRKSIVWRIGDREEKVFLRYNFLKHACD